MTGQTPVIPDMTELLNLYPHLSAADLVNVWVYAKAYPEEIEEAIRENDEVMQEDDDEAIAQADTR